jgi:hypothetical protein
MKNTLAIALILVGFCVHAQVTRRVNNIPGFNAQYTTISDALAASSAGDIILLDGSPFPYDPSVTILVISKKITITGPGYFLDQNAGVQAGRNPAFIQPVIQYNTGSEGSILQGITNQGSIYVLASNITISHNRLVNIYIQNVIPCSNLIIHANDFSLNVYTYACIQGSGSQPNNVYTGIVVSNNILVGWMYVYPIDYGTFVNNHFTATGPNNHQFGNLDVANSVLYNASTSTTFTFLSTSVQNNVLCGSGFPALDPALNNKSGQDINAVYVNTGSSDAQYILKAGSPAAGAGLGGVDDGPFGGPNPYTLSGAIEGNPAITNFIVPANIPQNATLNVKVSAKSN